MSTVYLVEDIKGRLKKQWAVKEIRTKGVSKEDKRLVKRLMDEAHLLNELQYSAFPIVSEIREEKEITYVVMEYIIGESLDKVLLEEKKLSEERVVAWAQDICKALSNLHSKNIIYNDMKPANIMLTGEEQIKIIDFGIAQKYEPNKKAPGRTKGYSPPEQINGTTDARSDIYALGMTMYNLLTGKNPPRLEDGEKYIPIRQWEPSLSEGIEVVINKCVQENPKDRYQSCEEVWEALEKRHIYNLPYIRKLKKKRNTFVASVVFAVVMLLTGIGCRWTAKYMNDNTYENLIASQAETLEGKIAEYKQGIAIYPSDTRAYTKILEAYVAEGKFGREEHGEFAAVYNANKDKLDKTSVEVAELNYMIGKMYFNYYKEEDGDYKFSERIQKAYPFFKENYLGEFSESFEYQKLSNCYYQICEFYTKYILASATVEEASQKDYEQLLDTMKETMEDVQNASQYEQLILYNGIMMFLYDQRADMASVNVEIDDIMVLMDKIIQKTESLTVNKTESKTLQTEILNNCEKYKEAIQRIYVNTQERS